MRMFEHIRTKITAAPIPIAFAKEVDTANAGQVPRTSLNTGF